MCGRFTLTISSEELTKYIFDRYLIEMKEDGFDLPRFNIAPGTDIISVLNDGKKYRIGLLKWGLVPVIREKQLDFSLINAKAEGIFGKPLFKEAVMKRRCVVLADSFYEWNRDDKTKTPRRIYTTDRKVFPIAAIWNTALDKEGKKIHTVALLTVASNSLIREIHARMPVILDKEAERTWLNPEIQDPSVLSALLKPYQSENMKMYKVGNKVNNAHYDKPDAVDGIKDEED